MGWSDDDHIINVQGDELLIPIKVINALIDKLKAAPTLQMATVSEPLEHPADYANPNVVKVVTDDFGMRCISSQHSFCSRYAGGWDYFR